MATLEQIALAAISGNALDVRSMVQDWLAESPASRDARRPETEDERVLAVAASVIELLTERSGESPPMWTNFVAPLKEPLFLLTAAKTLPRMRALCERETPAALRKRGIFAPPNYLSFA